MKLYLLITALVLQTMGIGYAQQKKSADEIAKELTGFMTEKLALDETQQIEVEAINLKYAKKQIELRDSGGSRYSMMREMKELNNSKTEELSSVLSESQLETYEDEVLPKLREQMKKHRKS